jgi:hypothetical protein
MLSKTGPPKPWFAVGRVQIEEDRVPREQLGRPLTDDHRRRLAANGARTERAFAFDRSPSMRIECGAH